MTAAGVHEPASLQSVWDVVNGIRVHGRVSDGAHVRQDGEPNVGRQLRDVVFVHGLGMSTRYLEPTMRLLARDFAVSGLDLPGFGETRLPGRVLSLSELAQVLDGWMRARGIQSPILVGQSHGCQVIVDCVTRVPRGGALVLNAPTMLPGHRSVLAQLWRVALDTPREPLSLAPRVARAYLRAGPGRILATLGDALGDRIEEKLARVAMPVTIVCGERDSVSPPAWGERLARLAGSEVAGPAAGTARFRVVAGAAHAVPFSHPEALAEEIVAIATRLDRAVAPM
jgi:pimeloyl-ACP methyl ester carboxylesterase